MIKHGFRLVSITLSSLALSSSAWAAPRLSMGQAQMGIALIIGTIIGMVCLGVLVSVLQPQRVIAGSERLGLSRGKTVVAGVLMIALIIFLLAIIKSLGDGGGLLFVVLCLWVAYESARGFAMVFHHVGEALQHNISSKTIGSSAWATFFGGVIVMGVSLIPFVGLAVFLIVWVLALGLSIRQRFADRAARRQSVPVESTANAQAPN